MLRVAESTRGWVESCHSVPRSTARAWIARELTHSSSHSCAPDGHSWIHVPNADRPGPGDRCPTALSLLPGALAAVGSRARALLPLHRRDRARERPDLPRGRDRDRVRPAPLHRGRPQAGGGAQVLPAARRSRARRGPDRISGAAEGSRWRDRSHSGCPTAISPAWFRSGLGAGLGPGRIRRCRGLTAPAPAGSAPAAWKVACGSACRAGRRGDGVGATESRPGRRRRDDGSDHRRLRESVARGGFGADLRRRDRRGRTARKWPGRPASGGVG